MARSKSILKKRDSLVGDVENSYVYLNTSNFSKTPRFYFFKNGSGVVREMYEKIEGLFDNATYYGHALSGFSTSPDGNENFVAANSEDVLLADTVYYPVYDFSKIVKLDIPLFDEDGKWNYNPLKNVDELMADGEPYAIQYSIFKSNSDSDEYSGLNAASVDVDNRQIVNMRSDKLSDVELDLENSFIVSSSEPISSYGYLVESLVDELSVVPTSLALLGPREPPTQAIIIYNGDLVIPSDLSNQTRGKYEGVIVPLTGENRIIEKTYFNVDLEWISANSPYDFKGWHLSGDNNKLTDDYELPTNISTIVLGPTYESKSGEISWLDWVTLPTRYEVGGLLAPRPIVYNLQLPLRSNFDTGNVNHLVFDLNGSNLSNVLSCLDNFGDPIPRLFTKVDICADFYLKLPAGVELYQLSSAKVQTTIHSFVYTTDDGIQAPRWRYLNLSSFSKVDEETNLYMKSVLWEDTYAYNNRGALQFMWTCIDIWNAKIFPYNGAKPTLTLSSLHIRKPIWRFNSSSPNIKPGFD